MWFRASRDPFQGVRATTDPIEWVEHLLWVLSKFVDACFGQIFRRNGILHRHVQFRHYPIAGRPAEEWLPCILDRKMIILFCFDKIETELKKVFRITCSLFPYHLESFSNISKRFSKKCSAHLEIVCKVIRTYFQMLSRILNSFSKSEALLYCGTLCTLYCPE